MGPKRLGELVQRLHPPPHEGHGADRPAAQAVPRCRARPLARAAGHLRNGRERRRHAAQQPWATRSRSSTSSSWSCGSSRSATSTRPPGRAPSWSGCEADLEEVAASGKKAIVFSQWVKCLEILSAPAPAVRPARISRQDPVASSATASCKQFKEDKSKHVILMSYGAGSVGLNLQFCEYVFLFDRWWNPAVEDQAINRAHRIGAAGPGHRHADARARHDRGADQPGPRAQARAVRPDHRPDRRPRQPRPLASARSSASSTSARPKGRSGRRLDIPFSP